MPITAPEKMPSGCLFLSNQKYKTKTLIQIPQEKHQILKNEKLLDIFALKTIETINWLFVTPNRTFTFNSPKIRLFLISYLLR